MRRRRHLSSVMTAAAILAAGCSDTTGPPLPRDELAYRSLAEGGIFLMKADGSGRRRIWFDNDYAMCDSWSPDGSAIAFHLNDADQIVKVTVSSGRVDTLTSGPNGSECPMWSPDGRRIAFIRIVRDSVTSGFQLYTMNANGTSPTRLGTGTFMADRGSWSPDGRWIAVTRYSDDKIVLVNATTGEVGPSLVGGRAPSWSPDGRRIAFDAQVGGDMQIYVMNADGANVQRLTVDDSLGLNDQYPVWTLDGTLITFHRYQYMRDTTAIPTSGPRLVASLHMITPEGSAVRWAVGDSAGGDLVVWRPRQ